MTLFAVPEFRNFFSVMRDVQFLPLSDAGREVFVILPLPQIPQLNLMLQIWPSKRFKKHLVNGLFATSPISEEDACSDVNGALSRRERYEA